MRGPRAGGGGFCLWEKRGLGDIGTGGGARISRKGACLLSVPLGVLGEGRSYWFAGELGSNWAEGGPGSFHPHPFCPLWEEGRSEKHELRDPWGTTGLPTPPAVHLEMGRQPPPPCPPTSLPLSFSSGSPLGPSPLF